MLRQKESDLEKTEDLLNSFQQEVHLLSKERKRLLGLQNNLELELETSAQAHKQLAEQKTENEKLKEIIDTLKTDLDEALFLQSSSSSVKFMDALEEKEQDQITIPSIESHALGPASVPIKVNCLVLYYLVFFY
jgi:DNA repair exonuclease SbcCD ATPase subunit